MPAPTGERVAAPPTPRAVAVTTAAVVQQPVTRFIRVSGTLAAQEEAEVAAEVAGRVVATPIERGSRVAADGDLIQIADAEVAAQAREADANAAQIEARLGTASGARVRRRARARSRQRPGRPTSWRAPSSSAPRCCRSGS